MASDLGIRVGVSLDDIGAFLWYRMPQAERLTLCAAAALPDAVAVATFHWYEIHTDTRDKLGGQMATRIVFDAGLQRLRHTEAV